MDEVVANLERQGSKAGLDVVRISPADDLPEELVFSGAFQNILRGTEVEVGKYFTRQLFISAQGRATPETLPGLLVEFRPGEGFIVRSSWEPRYLPREPTFATQETADPARTFGLFLLWQRRY